MPACFESVLRQNLPPGLFLSESIMAFSRGEASNGRGSATIGLFLRARKSAKPVARRTMTSCYHTLLRFTRSAGFPNRASAVDREADTSDKVVAGQKNHRVGDVFRAAGSLEKRAFYGPLADLFGKIGWHHYRPWEHRIHSHAWGQLDGERAGQRRDRGLGSEVGSIIAIRPGDRPVADV